jgi:hypothetical protein
LLCACLGACAAPKPTTEAYIQAGAFTLEPDSVVIDKGPPVVVTAQLSIDGAHKHVAVLGSECNDGIGSIRILEQMNGIDNSQIYAFDRGDKPPDQLFAQLCELRKRKMADKPDASR